MPKQKRRFRQAHDASIVSQIKRVKTLDPKTFENIDINEAEYFQAFDIPTINEEYYDFFDFNEYSENQSENLFNNNFELQEGNEASIPVVQENTSNALVTLLERNLVEISLKSIDIDHVSIVS